VKDEITKLNLPYISTSNYRAKSFIENMEFSHCFALLHVPFTFCMVNREEKLYIYTWGGRR